MKANIENLLDTSLTSSDVESSLLEFREKSKKTLSEEITNLAC